MPKMSEANPEQKPETQTVDPVAVLRSVRRALSNLAAQIDAIVGDS